MIFKSVTIIFVLIGIILHQSLVVHCDTWITLWNKLNMPVEIQCFRDSATKVRKFKKKIIEPDDRYDIKG